MPTRDEIKAAGGNDVGEWGEKELSSYTEPFKVAGEEVDLTKLPKFGEHDEPSSSMGDLESTGSSGNFGDIYEEETEPGQRRAPLRRR